MPFFGVPLRNGVPIGLGSVAGFGISPFDPSQLFASGEQGVWYDPSDFSTMFQDSAGTTPVTAVEQPVGLILDKSKGLVLGSELVTNGTFASDTGWTKAAGVTISGGAAVFSSVNSTAALRQAGVVSPSKTYQVVFTISSYSSGTTSVGYRVGTTTTFTVLTSTFSANGTFIARITIPADAGGEIFWSGGGSASFSIDNISVRELPGNHASQSTSASRPVLSARYNVLVNTPFAGAVAGSPGTAPTSWPFIVSTGTIISITNERLAVSVSSSRLVIGQTISYAANTTYKFVFTVHSNSGLVASQIFSWNQSISGATESFFANGVSQNASSYAPAPGDNIEYRLAVGATAGSSAIRLGAGCTSNTTGTVEFSQPDLRVTNDGVGLPSYQRVAAATDYDTTGFSTYLRFDGTDDSLATASIDFSATDKVTAWVGVRKLSDAAVAVVCELSASLSANNGTFHLAAPVTAGSNDYRFNNRGTAAAPATYVNAAVAAPNTSVVTGLGNISGDSTILRLNGAQVASDTVTDQGTGNFGNYPLYIGRRGGSTLPYNGRLYSLIVRGAQSTDAQIASAEAWVNQKTGAY